MDNLDLRCAELGQDLAGRSGVNDKMLTDALAVLEEQGVYACFLYLKARAGQPGQQIIDRCVTFLRQHPAGAALLGNGDAFTALQKLAGDLDRLLFARDLLRQALVYGRYHAKAKA